MAKKQTYENGGTKNGPMKRLQLEYFAKIVSGLSPAQILDRAKVFRKIWGPADSFAKNVIRAKVRNVLKSS